MKLWTSLVAKVGKVAAWIIVGAVALAALWGVSALRACQQARQDHAQAKVDDAQHKAFAASASDAISTQGNVAANAIASEDLSRSNEQDIRHAKGADQTIDPAARDAGFASLCKRADFVANPANRLRCPHPAVMAGANPRP